MPVTPSVAPTYAYVSVPFNAGRGLMPVVGQRIWDGQQVSVPFNAGRGLMRFGGQAPG